MASSLLLPHLHCSYSLFLNPSKLTTTQSSKPLKFLHLRQVLKPHFASLNGGGDTSNGAVESRKPSRRGGRKKKTTSSSTSTPTKGTGRSKKTEPENGKLEAAAAESDSELEDYDDGIDFPYESPPLVCCFGAAQKDFVPIVRVHDIQMDPDIYSEWKMLQWNPPDFARAPGGPVTNVAISHVRLGGRAAFIGKVGDDEMGEEFVRTLNEEKVQTRGVKFADNLKTARSCMKVKFDEDGKLKMEMVKEAAEDSLLPSEVNLSVLKEAGILHFNAEVFTSSSMASSLYRAITWTKKFGGLVFFDPNLPLPLWKSRDETRELIMKAWNQADIIEVSKEELEFLLDEDYYVRKRTYVPQYYAENFEQSNSVRRGRTYYHYTREDVLPLWHDGLKFLFVTDGTLRIHYYTPSFDGAVVGTEDVLVTPFTCDRTGSGDAVVAAIIRKITTCPEMSENQDVMERQLRFAIAAGIISQWTIGSVRGFPTEGATQNLKEQVYVPSLW